MRRRRGNRTTPMKRDLGTDQRIAYTRKAPIMVFQLALLGAKDDEIAAAFGVSVRTINTWKETHPDFHKAMIKGKCKADAKVAHGFYKCAIGFEYDDEVILTNRVKERDEKGKVVKEYTEPLRVPVRKQYLPNHAAAYKWLKARRPEEWGERLEISANMNVTHKMDLSKLSMEELKVLHKLQGKQLPEDVAYVDVEYKELENGDRE